MNHKLNRLLSIAVTFFCGLLPLTGLASSIWIEAETPVTSTMHRHPWWYDKIKADVISGMGWMSNYSEKGPGEASYKFDAQEEGNYTFWIRANPLSSGISYKLDGGSATPIDLQKDKRGVQNVAADGKPDLRFIAWSKVGIIKLEAGNHNISFKIGGGKENHGAIDCFVLTTDPFIPQGTMKPDAATVGTARETDAGPEHAIWIEGESSVKNTMTRHPWWYDQVKKDVLSGGDWISNYNKDKAGEADYAFNVITDDTYAFWLRANPSAGASLDWQLDAGDWNPVDFKDKRGQQNIAADNKPDMRYISWQKSGSVALTAGKHTIRFRMASGAGANNHGGLDCFVFTRIPFVPAGSRHPMVAQAAGGPGDWYPLLANDDPFDPASVIDMSRFIPKPAGQFGFLKADGKDLRFEKAKKPIKLWGCGANLESGKYSHEQLTQRAKYLRKFGINVVRQHPLFDEVSTNGKIDAKKLDQYDWWFAELKKNGIYTDWSVFYSFTITPDASYDAALYNELEGGPALKNTYGVITAAPKLWEIRNKVLETLLTHKNPYTGLRYVDDPALAVVEMQNEDSIFFWNPLNVLADAEPKKWPLHARQLRQWFAAWVKNKYKTDAALSAAWTTLKAGDSINAAELRLMTPWELAGAGPQGLFSGNKKRAGDCIEFLADLQRQEFENCELVIRGAGFKGVTMTTAWQVGGAASESANIWTDTVGGMIDRHNYTGGGAGGHGITEGKVNNESHLAHPGGGIFSIAMKQVESKPFSITEWTQSAPNQWKAEAAPIMAFYGLGLQGWDASYHFAQSGTRLGDGYPHMSSYSSDTPAYIGQFPALAFALYNQHIAEAPIVAARRLEKEDLFTGVDVLKQDATKGGYDVKTLIVDGGTPLEAFAIGRVTVDFEGGKVQQDDFAKYWDQSAKKISSATGELAWDYGSQVITVNTARTQAVIGRTGMNKFILPSVEITFKTPFVSTIFTPLDNLPLAVSRDILITALAQDQQTGTRYSADGKRLEAVGTAPLLLEPVQATIKIAGPKPTLVQPCDHYGVPMKNKSVPVGSDGTFAIDGTYRAYYFVVKR
jgi:hypothetical protein